MYDNNNAARKIICKLFYSNACNQMADHSIINTNKNNLYHVKLNAVVTKTIELNGK